MTTDESFPRNIAVNRPEHVKRCTFSFRDAVSTKIPRFVRAVVHKRRTHGASELLRGDLTWEVNNDLTELLGTLVP